MEARNRTKSIYRVLVSAIAFILVTAGMLNVSISPSISKSYLSFKDSLCFQNADLPAKFLHMSVKTGNVNHDTRMVTLLKTWIPVAQQINFRAGRQIIDKVSVITDVLEPPSLMEDLAQPLDVLIRGVHCKGGHGGFALHCKTYHEFEQYYRSEEASSWYCHTDDDVYINLPNLITVLQHFDYSKPYFLGKAVRINMTDKLRIKHEYPKDMSLVFASGCSYCLSKRLMQLFRPVMLQFQNKPNYRQAAKMYDHRGGGVGDDTLLSLISTEYLNVSITHVDGFYDHTNIPTAVGPRLDELTEEQVLHAMTLSYHKSGNLFVKLPDVDGQNNSLPNDPGRFLQLHNYYLRKGSYRMCE